MSAHRPARSAAPADGHRRSAWMLAHGLVLGLLLALPAAAATPAAASAPRPTDATPSPATGTISGRVTAAGAPVAYAWVRLLPEADGGGTQPGALRTITDERGRYAFVGVPPMRATLQVQAPAGMPLVDTYWPAAFTRRDAGVLAVGAQKVTADVELPRGRTVTGRVLDPMTLWLVPGVTVVATVPGQAVPEVVGDVNPTAGAGRFRIDNLPPIPLQLQVRLPTDSAYLGPWYWPAPDAGSDPLAIDAGAREPEVTIRLQRAAELRGTVRDEQGEPVPRALVQVQGCPLICPVAVPSDARGRYRITGIPPTDGLTLRAWLGGETFRTWFDGARSAEAATRFALASGEVREAMDLTMPSGAQLRLRVIGANGRPLPDVLAQLRPEPAAASGVAGGSAGGGGYGPRRNFAVADPQDAGRRIIGPVPPGSYRLVLGLDPTSGGCTTGPFAQGTAGVGRDGLLTLAAGERAEAVVRLTCPTVAGGSGEEGAPTSMPGTSSTDAASRSVADSGRAPGACGDRGANGAAWPWPDPQEVLFRPPAWAQPAAA